MSTSPTSSESSSWAWDCDEMDKEVRRLKEQGQHVFRRESLGPLQLSPDRRRRSSSDNTYWSPSPVLRHHLKNTQSQPVPDPTDKENCTGNQQACRPDLGSSCRSVQRPRCPVDDDGTDHHKGGLGCPFKDSRATKQLSYRPSSDQMYSSTSSEVMESQRHTIANLHGKINELELQLRKTRGELASVKEEHVLETVQLKSEISSLTEELKMVRLVYARELVPPLVDLDVAEAFSLVQSPTNPVTSPLSCHSTASEEVVFWGSARKLIPTPKSKPRHSDNLEARVAQLEQELVTSKLERCEALTQLDSARFQLSAQNLNSNSLTQLQAENRRLVEMVVSLKTENFNLLDRLLDLDECDDLATV